MRNARLTMDDEPGMDDVKDRRRFVALLKTGGFGKEKKKMTVADRSSSCQHFLV
jgi:hypothetical protein